MFKNLFQKLFRNEMVMPEPAYSSREVWSYRHVDPTTRRVSEKPVLVFRKATDGMFWGLPLTNIGKKGKPLYVPRLKNGKKVSALSQMRTLKAERLLRRLGKAGEKEFGALSTAIVRLLAETTPLQAPIVQRRVQRKVLAVRPRYQHTLPSPFSPVYILQPR